MGQKLSEEKEVWQSCCETKTVQFFLPHVVGKRSNRSQKAECIFGEPYVVLVEYTPVSSHTHSA